MKASALLKMSLLMAAMSEATLPNYGSYGNRKSGDSSNKGLPYFYFKHDGRTYKIQAVNETSAKLKFDKIISKKTQTK